jgi:hypothetical protein
LEPLGRVASAESSTHTTGTVLRLVPVAELEAAITQGRKPGRPPEASRITTGSDLMRVIPPSNYLIVMTELKQAETMLLAAELFSEHHPPTPRRREMTDAELDEEEAALAAEFAAEENPDDVFADPAQVLPELLDRVGRRIGLRRLEHVVRGLIEHGPRVTTKLYPFTSEREFEHDRQRRAEREEAFDEGRDRAEVLAHLQGDDEC